MRILLLIFCMLSMVIVKADDKKNDKKSSKLKMFRPYFEIGKHARISRDMATFIDNFNSYYNFNAEQAMALKSNFNYGYGIIIERKGVLYKIGFSKYFTNYSTGTLTGGYKMRIDYKEMMPLKLEVGTNFKKRIDVCWGLSYVTSGIHGYRLYSDKSKNYSHNILFAGPWEYKNLSLATTLYGTVHFDKKQHINLVLGFDKVWGNDYYSYKFYNASLDNNMIGFPITPDQSKSNADRMLDGEYIRGRNFRPFAKLLLEL